MNIINGRIVDKADALRFLDDIDSAVQKTLQNRELTLEIVIAAADKLSVELDTPEVLDMLAALGLEESKAKGMLAEVRAFLSREWLENKVERELGSRPFEYRQIEPGIWEKFQPLGVLTHIAAGNASGLPAFSVLEGLLACNINLLKLPGGDDGLSTSILKRLIDIEPRLAPYIHVFDLPSTDAGSIRKMLAASDAVAVWGSDFAINGIRSLAPPNLPIIEWGHRLSFAFVTAAGETPEALQGIARDICETEQLLCNSPQCVYFEAENFEELAAFAGRFAKALDTVSRQCPAKPLDRFVQAEITALLALTGMEELLENKKGIRGEGWSVIAEENPTLKPSPMFRTVWVKPIKKETMFSVFQLQKGYLQTVGLACAKAEYEAVASALFACGACRIMPCGAMASGYAGEPHDGASALRRYVRTVVSRQS